MKKNTVFMLLAAVTGWAQSYPPEAGTPGSTAIHKDSPLYVAWATGITVERGYINKSNPAATANGSNKASAGEPENALGYPDGATVSLGDEGNAILTFAQPIIDGDGFDFAVFENGGPAFLELAFVEVSSDGVHFFRFPAHSQTQTTTQIGSFGSPSAPYLNNLAGKYAGLYGTPFDLGELPEDTFLDKNNITHVKVVDVVGSINPDFATFDSFGNAVNDSFPTPFNSCGFDLQAVGVIHQADLGMDDPSGKSVQLYPNPAQEHFFVALDEPSEVKLFDISGREILKKTITAGEAIPVSGFPKGIYLVEVTAFQKEKMSRRLIIN